MADTPDAGTVPDFAALYGIDDHPDAVLTPRLAYVLCETAWYLADEWRLVAEDAYARRHLPPVAQTSAASQAWRERFAQCFERLGERIAAGDGETSVLATCTGEELALHMILTIAWQHLADGRYEDELAELPDLGADDRAFARLQEVLFEDHDVLLLYRADLDGIEDHDLVAESNLHPRDWFTPFR